MGSFAASMSSYLEGPCSESQVNFLQNQYDMVVTHSYAYELNDADDTLALLENTKACVAGVRPGNPDAPTTRPVDAAGVNATIAANNVAKTTLPTTPATPDPIVSSGPLPVSPTVMVGLLVGLAVLVLLVK